MVTIRKALKEDMAAVHALITELAVYEREPDAVIISVEDLKHHGFTEQRFDCFVAAHEQFGVIGMALYYPRYSTWKGPTLHLEDLYVKPEYRMSGLGKQLFDKVIAATVVATAICERLFGPIWGPIIVTIGLTLIILVFAEVTPKTLAALYPEKIAFPSSMLLLPMLTIMKPAVYAINGVTNGLLGLLNVKPTDANNDALSPEELRTIVFEAGSMIPKRHQDMLVSILDLENVTAEDIMIPRNEIVAIDVNDDWKDIQKQLVNSQHTRVLLYRDTIDDAVGFVHVRDALRLLSKDQFSKATLLRAVREIYYTPESTKLHTLMYKFQTEKERIGLVVDEYGDIQGLVTLEDILEEIIGDFTTSMIPTHSKEVTEQQDGSVLVDGSANIRELNKEMEWLLPIEGPKTLSGLVVEYLEEIPEHKVSIRLAGYPMEIVDISENKIKTVRVMPTLFRAPQQNSEEH